MLVRFRCLLLWWMWIVSAWCKDYVRVCYLMSWAYRRKPVVRFTTNDIPPDLCTHIIYAFARIEENGRLVMNENNAMFKELQIFSKKNPDLKILLSVGGWGHDAGDVSPFSNMVQTVPTRKKFLDHTLSLLRKYNLHGLDLDWEYPTQRGNSPPGDKEKYTTFVKELYDEFGKEASASGKPRLLLTAAVSAYEHIVTKAYEISKLSEILDALHLMTYDLHGAWETKVGHHTSMDGSDLLSVPHGLDVWLKGGFPADKIVLGIATYGRTFTLASSASHDIGAPATRGGEKQIFTDEFGFAAYYEICQKARHGMTVNKNNIVMASYGYQGNYWVGYDDVTSIKYKVKTLVIGKYIQL